MMKQYNFLTGRSPRQSVASGFAAIWKKRATVCQCVQLQS
jgi:hypothetical protein